ncbi:hypothetical protein SAMN02910369_00228 [Lachnospiraceae bacterium NE2001]|nr:hypothetical protein SAMN02910369_00228 [Lachnospiraceae bacterium NE2001]
MKNRGYVTIFLSLMLVVMLIVVTAVLKISSEEGAKSKVVTATSSAMSSELANYNRLIFDRYHILLLDKNSSGLGEGAMEEDMEELLQIDLGDDFTVNSVQLSGSTYLMDNNLSEFKSQIRDNFKYEALSYTVDKIIEKTGSQDDPVDEEDLDAMEQDISEEKQRISAEESGSEGDSSDYISNEDSENASKDDSNSDSTGEVTDPRDTLKTYTDAGIASILLPSNVTLSENRISTSGQSGELPSTGRGVSLFGEVDTSFDSLDRMELDTGKSSGWGSSLLTYMETVMYGAECFNCLTDQKYDDTYLNLEMEYIVAGEDSDGANYKKVVNEILLIRFGFNFAYILTDNTKQEECEAVATALTVEFPPAMPVVKYLLMGCWSYIESVMDVYMLVRGHSVPFWKSSTSWLTDFESLAHLSELESGASDDESGLDYKEYLMILMALQGDDMYYRMLDLMQLNVTQSDIEGGDTTFRMRNAITAFGADISVSYKGKEIDVHEESGY